MRLFFVRKSLMFIDDFYLMHSFYTKITGKMTDESLCVHDSKDRRSLRIRKKISYPIIDINQMNRIKFNLDLWADCFYGLENKFLHEMHGFIEKDYDFIRLVGKSVYYLNFANSLMISSIEDYLHEKNKFDDVDKELKILCQFMRFYNNLIASKIKYYFFRETPIPNQNYPFMSINKEIFKSGWGLINGFSSKKIDIHELSNLVYKYYYYQGLVYSFIFNEKKKFGVFIDFGYSAENFQKIKERIECYLSTLLDDRGLIGVQLFASKLSCGIMDFYCKDSRDYVCEKGALIIGKPSCFNEFCDLYKSENIIVEPLTFRLIDILWKISGMLNIGRKQMYSLDKRENFNEICNEKTGYFIRDYLIKVNDMYDNNVVKFDELYLCERQLFLGAEKTVDRLKSSEKKVCEDEYKGIGVYNMIFSEKNASDVRSRIKSQKEVVGEKRYLTNTAAHNNESEIKKKINKIAKNNENGLKLTKLIESLEPKDLLQILSLYANMINIQGSNESKDEYVAIYKSGVFLAHMVNMILDGEKCVWLFSTRPCVSAHPIHKEDDYKGFDRVILFDESLKTGFTYTLYESYVLRNLNKCNLKVLFFTIFDFIYYNRVKNIDADLFSSLFKVNDLLKVFTRNQQYSNDDDTASNYGFIYKPVDSILDSIKNEKDEIDLIYILSDTNSVFSVCSDFRDHIEERCFDKAKRIVLFSPSENGEVLAMITGFLLKDRGRNVGFVLGNDINHYSRDNSYFVAIDLSIASGFSIDYKWSIIRNKEYKPDFSVDIYCKNLEKYLDIVLVVSSNIEYQSEKIISLKN